ncbi:hypothetical protein [uncultured Kordia sp.]|uniref:hypothetical protein n=1 Tax=uncultured Kordia sp. TaxID=507699 RepID=UPI0026212DAD|nr:hypothetical protein [uncultured Kordia sp.]
MKKFCILLFSLCLIGCFNEKKLLKNGLTKKATQITEYTIKTKKKYSSSDISDTLLVNIKKYNQNDQIVSAQKRYLFSEDTMKSEFHYNKNQKIEKEIVKYLNDNSSFTVHYFYKDTLLIGTESKHKNDERAFEYIGTYIYDINDKLKESTLTQLYIDMETNDTIKNTLEVKKYNAKQLVTTSTISDFVTPEKSQHFSYTYVHKTLVKVKKYDTKDSLISTIENEYEFDRYDNWITRKTSINGKLDHTLTRVISYK